MQLSRCPLTNVKAVVLDSLRVEPKTQYLGVLNGVARICVETGLASDAPPRNIDSGPHALASIDQERVLEDPSGTW